MNSIKLRYAASLANVGPGYDIFALGLKEPYDDLSVTLTSDIDI